MRCKLEKELKEEKIGKEEYIKKLEKLTSKYNNIWNAYYDDFSKTFKLKEEQEKLNEDQKAYGEYIENADIWMTDELNSANDKKEKLQKELDQIEEKLNDKNISNQEKELLLKNKEDIQFELEDIQLEIELLEVKSFANNAPEDKSDDIEDIKLDIDQEEYTNTSMGNTEADYDKRLKECLEEIQEYIDENEIELYITEEEKQEIIVDKYKTNSEIINKYDKKVKKTRIDIEKDEYSEEKNSLLKAISTVGIYERNREKIQEDSNLLQFEEEINKEKSEKELEEQNRLSFEWYENGKRYRYTEIIKKDSTKEDKQEEKENNNQSKEKKKDEEEEKYRNKYDKNYNEIKEVEENLNNYKEEKEKLEKEVDKATMLQVILQKITAQKGKLCTAETRHIVRDMYNDLENKLDQEEDEINKIVIKKQMESLENTGLDLTDKKILAETFEEDILDNAKIAIEEIVEIEAGFELQKELLNEDRNLEEEQIKEEEKEQEDNKEKEIEEPENKSIVEQIDEKIQNMNYEIQDNEISDRDDDELER